MNKIAKRVVLGAVGMATFLCASAGYFLYHQLHPGLPQDLAAYGQVRLTDDAGSSVRLSDVTRPHSATLLAFWASWCGPCHNEAAIIASLRKRFTPEALSIIYVNVEDRPSAGSTTTFLRSSHADGLPVYYAAHEGWKAITGSDTVALPRSYVFDRSGKAVAAFAGFDKIDGATALQTGLEKAVAK